MGPLEIKLLIAAGSWFTTQVLKKKIAPKIPKKYLPYVTLLTAIVATVATGGTDSSTLGQAIQGAMTGGMAIGGHEVVTKLGGK